MIYVYILKSEKDQGYYVGHSSDPWKRLREHNSQRTFSTKGRIPFQMIFCEPFVNRDTAISHERKIKNQGVRRFLNKANASYSDEEKDLMRAEAPTGV